MRPTIAVMTPSTVRTLDPRTCHMRLLLVPALTLLLAGCAHRASEVRPVPPVAVPDAFRASAIIIAVVPHWLTTFADPTLESLVREAWTANPDLRATAARLAQAEARATQAGAARLPSVSAQFGATRGRSNPDLGAGPQARYSTEYNAGLGVAWEIDVWGRLAAGSRAEGAEAIAAQKVLIRKWEELPLKDAIDASIGIFGRSFLTGEPQHHMQKFIDRPRKPKGN